MSLACGVGAFVAIGGIRVVLGGCEGYGPVGGCRSQRAAMGGMSDIREKTD